MFPNLFPFVYLELNLSVSNEFVPPLYYEKLNDSKFSTAFIIQSLCWA